MSKERLSNWSESGEGHNQLQILSGREVLLRLNIGSPSDIIADVYSYRDKYLQYGGCSDEVLNLLNSEWTKENFTDQYLMLERLVREES